MTDADPTEPSDTPRPGAGSHPREAVLRAILSEQSVASLATLHRGRPAVSMVPFAVLPGDGQLVIHVSRLATHTGDMQACPDVSLLVMAERRPDVAPQALARLSVNGRVHFCPSNDRMHALARQAYLQRFADTAPLFDFSDFSLALIEPQSVRVIGGFAQAWTLTGDQYRNALGVAGAAA